MSNNETFFDFDIIPVSFSEIYVLPCWSEVDNMGFWLSVTLFDRVWTMKIADSLALNFKIWPTMDNSFDAIWASNRDCFHLAFGSKFTKKHIFNTK